ncbi:MAG: hypothetical protein UV04_C0016G0012 [Candidatus Gottesmanbacteria bacterium GW2011_GWA2_42_16]|nr:MAG: hypothetical protein UV04_C0016G0012 [Candidatus Gottesmanbacteria bacterium GW2011_GWA2_42_16]
MSYSFYGVILTHPNPLFEKREGIPPLLGKGRKGGEYL